MSAFHDVILAGASGSQGYQISRSVRLRSSASAYFNRTPAGAGTSNKTFTYSAWVKRGALGSIQNLISSPNTGNSDSLRFSAADALEYNWQDTVLGQVTTTQVFRDPSAWYHIMFAMDTTQATAANRFRLYINGVQVTAFATASYPAQNTVVNNTSAVATKLGQYANSSAQSFDGYMAEINLIDGQALTPSSFGETDSITGVWKPKKYAGTYGTNGFYLNFSDNSAATAAAIGKDYSNASSSVIVGSSTNASTTLTVVSITGISVGNIVSGPGIPSNTYVTAIGVLQVTMSQAATSTNASQNYTFSGNNWTPNNISVTTGSTYDSMLDVPTPYADGGNGRGNYCVGNPLTATSGTLTNANLTFTGPSAAGGHAFGTFGISSGKYYWEATVTSDSSEIIGIQSTFTSNFNDIRGYSNSDGKYYVSGTGTTYGATFTTNNVIGIALDMDAGTLTFYKDGTSQGQATSSLTGTWFPAFRCFGTSSILALNFGQRPFAYTPPTGFKALNTQNLPDSTIKKGNQYFDVSLYTGTSAAQSIVNGGSMQPDFVWTKARNNASNHGLFDAVRGGSNILLSDSTGAEASGTYISSFNSNGFSVAGNSSALNLSTYTYAAWQWKESVTAGFDIVTFTNPSSGSSSFAHNLGVKPSMIIVKSRSNTSNWTTAHKSLGTNMADKWINLESTAAVQTSTNIWGGEPTSSVFYCGTGIQVAGATMVAYLFAEVAGFSKFGSYTGNGSADGPFVYCGFRPRWVLYKRTDAVTNWVIWDTSRNTYNVVNNYLLPNSSGAEGVLDSLDILSNGFKLRTSNADNNGSGGTFIYAAFAENPFRNALAR